MYHGYLEKLSVIVLTLSELCKSRSSGTFYLATTNGVSAFFQLWRGEIIKAECQDVKGTAALCCIKEIKQARYFFTHEKIPQKCDDAGECEYPNTLAILNYLN